MSEQPGLATVRRMPEPEIRLWPFRSLDPIPNPLPDDLDELSKYLAPVWVKSTTAGKPDPKPHGLMQLVVAARALCDDYPGDKLLGEIADTEARNKHQDERRYPVEARRHLVDITLAEAECSRLTEQRHDQAREWGGVLHLLYSERFPEVWSGEDRPNLNLPLWAPAESVLGVLGEWQPEFDKHACAGGNFALRATRVATTAAAAFLECLIEDGEEEAASFFIERFVPPPTEDLRFIGADSCDEILSAVDRIRRAQRTLTELYRGKPRRAMYVAIDGGGTRSTVVVHPPLQPQRRLEVGIPLTGSGSRADLAGRIDDIAREIARSTTDLPDRDVLRTVIAVGAAAGSPGELQSLKPLFKRAFERHLRKFDLVVMNDADIVLTAERLGLEQRSPDTARPVICLIVGTGSVLVSQRVDGSYLRLDGEQWVASDRCSGTELARRGLQVALIHRQLAVADADYKMWDILKLDPPGSPSHQDRQALLDELVEHFGYADIEQTVNALALDFSKAALASAATLIAELADTGNLAAKELVGEVAHNAADYVTAARCWVEVDSNDPILVVIGSLAGKCRTWQQKFIEYLGGEPDAMPDNDSGRVGWNVPGFEVVRPEVDAATMDLRVARRWATTQEEAKEAIGQCTFVSTSGGSDRRYGNRPLRTRARQ
jgi:N-acetylglucosamine kinase-like BadF-type ATPase